MSARSVEVGARRVTAGPDRLAAVLAAGLKEHCCVLSANDGGGEDDQRSTGVVVVPANPARIVPVVLPQPPLDDGKLRDGQLPGQFLERRKYPRAVWNTLPKELPSRKDKYGNELRFEIVEGTEALRSITTKQEKDRPVAEEVSVVEFAGASQYEYPARWSVNVYKREIGGKVGNALQKEEYVEFKDKGTAIESMSLSLTTLSRAGKDFPPTLSDPAAFQLEASLSETINQYGWIISTLNNGFLTTYELARRTRVSTDSNGLQLVYHRPTDDDDPMSKHDNVEVMAFRPIESKREGIPDLTVVYTNGKSAVYNRGSDVFFNPNTKQWSSSNERTLHFDKTQSSTFTKQSSDLNWMGSKKYKKDRQKAEKDRAQKFADDFQYSLATVGSMLVAFFLCTKIDPFEEHLSARGCAVTSLVLALAGVNWVHGFGATERTVLYYPHQDEWHFGP